MSQHLYSYVGNNPVNYIDPTGHAAVELANINANAAGYFKDFNIYMTDPVHAQAYLPKNPPAGSTYDQQIDDAVNEYWNSHVTAQDKMLVEQIIASGALENDTQAILEDILANNRMDALDINVYYVLLDDDEKTLAHYNSMVAYHEKKGQIIGGVVGGAAVSYFIPPFAPEIIKGAVSIGMTIGGSISGGNQAEDRILGRGGSLMQGRYAIYNRR